MAQLLSGEDVLGNFTDVPVSTIAGTIEELGKIGNWLQALGILVIIWIIIQIVNLVYNYKKKNYLESIESRLSNMEKKINRLYNKLK
jgi:Tfp pilus assembly protein PilO